MRAGAEAALIPSLPSYPPHTHKHKRKWRNVTPPMGTGGGEGGEEGWRGFPTVISTPSFVLQFSLDSPATLFFFFFSFENLF